MMTENQLRLKREARTFSRRKRQKSVRRANLCLSRQPPPVAPRLEVEVSPPRKAPLKSPSFLKRIKNFFFRRGV